MSDAVAHSQPRIESRVLCYLSTEPAGLAPDSLRLRRLDAENKRRVHKLQWRRQGDDSVTSWGPSAAGPFAIPRRNRQLLPIFVCGQPPGAQVLVWVLDQYLRTNRIGCRRGDFKQGNRSARRRRRRRRRMHTTWVIFTALRRSTDSDAPARMGANARICVVLSASVAKSVSIASMPCAVAHRLVQICCADPTEAQQAKMAARASSEHMIYRSSPLASGDHHHREQQPVISCFAVSAPLPYRYRTGLHVL
eukprot:COSAG02_NODE_3441_length_6735_cov_38.359233_2_plen_250_part_00